MKKNIDILWESINNFKDNAEHLNDDQVFNCIVNLTSLFVLTCCNHLISDDFTNDLTNRRLNKNMAIINELNDFVDEHICNPIYYKGSLKRDALFNSVLHNLSNDSYKFHLREYFAITFNEYLDIAPLLGDAFNINLFEYEIYQCRCNADVGSRRFFGDRGKLSYSIVRHYRLNDINRLKMKYSNCQHPYVNWTFQFISSLYGDKLNYLKKVLVRLTNMNLELEFRDSYKIYGYSYSLLAVIDLHRKGKYDELFFRLLKLAYFMISHLIFIEDDIDNIKLSDSYSNRARLVNAYSEQFTHIFFSESAALIDMRYNYVSDKYYAFITGKDNPFRLEFHKDALMMYQNGNIKRVTGNGLTSADEGTLQNVVDTGVMRSKCLYENLLDGYLSGRLFISEEEIDHIFDDLEEQWLKLNPIYPKLLEELLY